MLKVTIYLGVLMKTIKTNQKGFSALEIVIVLAVVGVIAAVGWFIYSRQQDKKTNSTQTATTQTAAQTTTEKTEEPASEQKYKAKSYTSSKGAFSMDILNGWTVEEDTTYDYFFQYSVDKLTYAEAKEPTVKKTANSGVGGYVPGIKVSVNNNHEEITKGEKFTLDDGTVGYCKKTVTTSKDDPTGTMADDKGDFISKDCFFKKADQKLKASYSYYEKEPLDVESVEYAFKTITFEN